MKNETTKHLKKFIILMSIILIGVITTSILITRNIKEKHDKETVELKSEIYNLTYELKSNQKINDSLYSIIESDNYLYYKIEQESSIKIPDYVDPEYIRYMYSEAISKDIPIDIMFRLVAKESSFYSDARSHVGAYGFMQLMPRTYKWYCERLGIPEEPYTEEKNIYIGTYMLAELYEHWYDKIDRLNYTDNIEREAWEHTLASYNAGISRVRYYGRIFNNEGVYNYVAYITQNYQ